MPEPTIESMRASFNAGIEELESTTGPAEALPPAWEAVGVEITAVRALLGEAATRLTAMQHEPIQEVRDNARNVGDNTEDAYEHFQVAEGSSSRDADFALGTTDLAMRTADRQAEQARKLDAATGEIAANLGSIIERMDELATMQVSGLTDGQQAAGAVSSALNVARTYRDSL